MKTQNRFCLSKIIPDFEPGENNATDGTVGQQNWRKDRGEFEGGKKDPCISRALGVGSNLTTKWRNTRKLVKNTR